MSAAGYFDVVQKIYIAFYQRPADPAGLKYWAERLEAADGDSSAIINAFATSAEATSLYGPINDQTISTVISSIYQTLFGRAPDPEGQAFYEAAFATGVLTAGNIALAILNAAQNDDQTVVSNKLTVANEFTQQIDGRTFDDAGFGTGSEFDYTYTPEERAENARKALAGVTADPDTVLDPKEVKNILDGEAPAPGGGGTGGGAVNSSVKLTIDKDVATANVFNAPAGTNPADQSPKNTLNSDDVLTGKGAALNFTFTEEGESPVAPTLNGITTINVAVVGSGNRELDLQKSDGVQSVNVSGVGEGVTAAVRNIRPADETKLINLSVKQSHAPDSSVTFTFANGALAGVDGAVNVTLNSAVLGELSLGEKAHPLVYGRPTASGDNAETINLVSTGAENEIGQLAANGLEKLVISGDQDLALGSSRVVTVGGREEAVVYGAGLSGAAEAFDIDASELGADLQIVLGAELAVDDLNSGPSITYTGTEHDDTIVLANGILGGSHTFDGGLGENKVVTLQSIQDGDFDNVQTLEVRGQGADTELDTFTVLAPAPAKQDIVVDAAQFDATLGAISVRNEGDMPGSMLVSTLDSSPSVPGKLALTTTLNNLSAVQAGNLTVLQGTTGNNGLEQNILNLSLEDATGNNDTVALTLDDSVNGDDRFNVQFNVANIAQVETIQLNDNDDKSNTVKLGEYAATVGLTLKGEAASPFTGTITLTGGTAGQFLNLDATSAGSTGNGGYGIATDGGSTDNAAQDEIQISYQGKNVSVRAFSSVSGDQVLVASHVSATEYVGDVILRVGQAKQLIELGSGNDTVIFADRTGNTAGTAGLTSGDKVVGGQGLDTIVLDGTGEQVLRSSEWSNLSGIDVIRLAGNTGSYHLTLSNHLLEQADAPEGHITIVNNDGYLTSGVPSSGAELAATIDTRELNDKNAVTFIGANDPGSAVQTIILDDESANGKHILNGGGSNAGNNNVLQIVNNAVVTIDDLANISNFSTIEFHNEAVSAQKLILSLDDDVVKALAGETHLTIEAHDNSLYSSLTASLEVQAGSLTDSSIHVFGSKADDVIVAGGGNDTIVGGDGSDNIQGGAGDDVIYIDSEPFGRKTSKYSPSDFWSNDTIDGGEGEDTLNLFYTDDTKVEVPTDAIVRNVEIINIEHSGDAAGIVIASGFEGAKEFWQSGIDHNVIGLGKDQVAGFRGTDGGLLLSYQDDVEKAAIELEDVAPRTIGSTFDISGTGLTTVSISGSTAGEADADPRSSIISLVATTENADWGTAATESIQTLEVSLTSNASLALTNFTNLTTFDASESTGDVYAQLWTTLKLEEVTMGSGNDIVAMGNQDDVTIDLGAGDDIVYVSGSASGNKITLGEGNDIVQITSKLINVATAVGEDFEESITTITGFNGTQDKLAFRTSGAGADPLEGTATLMGTAVELDSTGIGQIAASETLYDALQIAAGIIDGKGWATFQYEGSTYVFQNAAGTGNGTFGAEDGLVKLVGYTGELNDSNFLTDSSAGTP